MLEICPSYETITGYEAVVYWTTNSAFEERYIWEYSRPCFYRLLDLLDFLTHCREGDIESAQ